jgi:hypothetical protein
MNAQARDEKQGDRPENVPGRIRRMIDGGSPVKKRGSRNDDWSPKLVMEHHLKMISKGKVSA